MKRRSRPSAKPSALSESLHRQLNAYALAAGAAGVSLLALTQPAEAKVIYTKIHQVIGPNGIYALDFNHDGTIDLLIERVSGGTAYGESGSNALFVKQALGNAVAGSKVNSASYHTSYLASALSRGARIGPGAGFILPAALMFSFRARRGSSGGTFGRWKNLTNRFLGVRFKIDGKTHYGWARMTVQESGYQIYSTLTGYAYETIPNKAIRAGQTSQADDLTAGPGGNSDVSVPPTDAASETSQPTSLGRLARGAQRSSIGKQP
jgi:hypothetical protein